MRYEFKKIVRQKVFQKTGEVIQQRKTQLKQFLEAEDYESLSN